MFVCTGWRPKPTSALVNKYQQAWALIQECWRSKKHEMKGSFMSGVAADTMIKRPTFTEIAKNLESMLRPLMDGCIPDEKPGKSPALQSLLLAFDGVTATEIEQVEDLLNKLPALSAAPSHVGGSVAVLRRIRRHPTLALRRSQQMLKLRTELSSDAKGAEILEQGLSLHSFPGATKLEAASWETNELIGTDKEGNVVVFERWSATNPAKFLDEITIDDFNTYLTYRNEARALALDLLSRRAKRVVRVRNVIDVGRGTLAQRNFFPFIKVCMLCIISSISSLVSAFILFEKETICLGISFDL